MNLDQNLIFAIVIVAVVVVIIVAYHWYLRFKSNIYSVQASEAIDTLEKLSIPNRFFTDDELASFLSSNQKLKDYVEALYASHFISDSLLDEKGLDTFLKALEDAPDKKSHNNHIYNSIQTIKAKAKEINATLTYLFDADHYFAHSEFEAVKIDSAELLDAFNVVYPKYNQYIAEGYALDFYNQLYETIRTIEPRRLEHNKLFVDYQLIHNKEYFDNVLGKYPLDSQQRNSIVKLEDNCLVIASAGSGKTSTILAKAKYLVERRGINPGNILLLTYTRKAADELKDRMKIDGVECGTFHGLAYKILSEVNNQAPSICEASLPQAVFYRLLQTDTDFLKSINDYILNLQSLQKLEHDYDDAFSYFDDRKNMAYKPCSLTWTATSSIPVVRKRSAFAQSLQGMA